MREKIRIYCFLFVCIFLNAIYSVLKIYFTNKNTTKNLKSRIPFNFTFIERLLLFLIRSIHPKLKEFFYIVSIKDFKRHINLANHSSSVNDFLIKLNKKNQKNENIILYNDFMHDGHMGDIIYSLLFLCNVHKVKSSKINYYVKNDALNESFLIGHPSGGNLMISENSFNFLKPLVEQQVYIKKFTYSSLLKKKFIDLSLIRDGRINTSSGSISLWYEKRFNFPNDPTLRWLRASKKALKYKNSIIISRSERYQNNAIDYSFLCGIKNIYFIGLKKEYELFINEFDLRNISLISVKNALDAANIINSAKCFVGNQSFFFSLAEGLKCPRALEVYEPAPNVIPIGGKCTSYIQTQHLINFLKSFNLNIKNHNKYIKPFYTHIRK